MAKRRSAPCARTRLVAVFRPLGGVVCAVWVALACVGGRTVTSAPESGCSSSANTELGCAASLSQYCCGGGTQPISDCLASWTVAESCAAESYSNYMPLAACGGFLAAVRTTDFAEALLFDAADGHLVAELTIASGGSSCNAGPTSVTVPTACLNAWGQSKGAVPCTGGKDAGALPSPYNYCSVIATDR